MYEEMNEQTIECTNKQMNEQINKEQNRCKNTRVDEEIPAS